MGKTPKPLTFLVTGELILTPEIQALSEKGHRVIWLQWAPKDEPDIILSSRAWRMNLTLLKYLGVAVKAARSQRYSKDDKEAKE